MTNKTVKSYNIHLENLHANVRILCVQCTDYEMQVFTVCNDS